MMRQKNGQKELKNIQKQSGESGTSLDSVRLDTLKDYLEKEKFIFYENLHVRPNSNTIIISVPESAIGKKVTKNLISHRKLTFLKKKIASDLVITVEFIFVRGDFQNKIESGLYALLVSKFPRIIDEVFLSFNSNEIYDVWLVLAEGAQSNLEFNLEMRSIIEKYLKLFNAKLGLLKAGVDSDLPTLTQILRAAKRLSPIKANVLFNELKNSGLQAPSLSWIESKLDYLRKRKLVIRFCDGNYSVTEAGLALVPHYKSRNSSDIERALALGRRIW